MTTDMNKISHSELIDKLVENRLTMHFIVFAEVGIGSRWLQGSNLPVPDVMTLRYSYTRPDVTIYDIKNSKQDFSQDVNKAKYKRYLTFCDRFYFATSIGLLRKNEVPEDAGLIVYSSGKNTWSVVKASPRYKAKLDQIEWQSLMMAKYATERRARRLKERIVWKENLSVADKVKNLSHEVALKIREVEGVDEKIKDIKKLVAEGLGIDPEELYKRSEWDLRNCIRKVIKQLTVPREKELSAKIMSASAEILCGDVSYVYSRKNFIDWLQELTTLLKAQKE